MPVTQKYMTYSKQWSNVHKQLVRKVNPVQTGDYSITGRGNCIKQCLLNGLFTPVHIVQCVQHCIGHYINESVQHITQLKHLWLPAKTSQLWYFPHSNDLFATLASHIPFISPTPFLSSFQRGRLTEQGSIQPEGTVSGRRNLTSCSTQSRGYNLPVLSWPASLRIYTLHVCSQFGLYFISQNKQ